MGAFLFVSEEGFAYVQVQRNPIAFPALRLPYAMDHTHSKVSQCLQAAVPGFSH